MREFCFFFVSKSNMNTFAINPQSFLNGIKYKLLKKIRYFLYQKHWEIKIHTLNHTIIIIKERIRNGSNIRGGLQEHWDYLIIRGSESQVSRRVSDFIKVTEKPSSRITRTWHSEESRCFSWDISWWGIRKVGDVVRRIENKWRANSGEGSFCT